MGAEHWCGVGRERRSHEFSAPQAHLVETITIEDAGVATQGAPAKKDHPSFPEYESLRCHTPILLETGVALNCLGVELV